MPPEQIESILVDFANRATLVGSRMDGAEIWRFAFGEKQYDLLYWDHAAPSVGYAGAKQAGETFTRLQSLQKLGLPATRVIANLKGFRIGERKGDACIVIHEPMTVPLDQFLASRPLTRERRLRVVAMLVTMLETLHREKLCPLPLTVDRFALREPHGEARLIVSDAPGTLAGIVTPDRLRELDASTRFVTTAGERLRMWKHFTDAPVPRTSRSAASSLLHDARRGENRFGRIVHEDWIGTALRQSPMVVPWSTLNGQAIESSAWIEHLPALLQETDADSFKNDRSGVVRRVTLELNGRPIDLIVKRPAFKSGLRGTIQRIRTSRVKRTWHKTWRMLGLGFRCELPLLMLEKRSGLGVTDQLIVFEAVPGATLAKIELDALNETQRADLLFSCGRILSRIETFGFTHADAKNTNWIAWTAPDGTLHPVLIDLDGIRYYPWRGLGFERFDRAMRTHSQIRPADLTALADGYRA